MHPTEEQLQELFDVQIKTKHTMSSTVLDQPPYKVNNNLLETLLDDTKFKEKLRVVFQNSNPPVKLNEVYLTLHSMTNHASCKSHQVIYLGCGSSVLMADHYPLEIKIPFSEVYEELLKQRRDSLGFTLYYKGEAYTNMITIRIAGLDLETEI